MKFPDAFVEQVKAAFRLSEYIGRSLPLKRAGREFVGLSPFNAEKTPSFTINDDKAFWCDFSSGKTGDIVDWLMLQDGQTFVEAIERLAGEAGIPLPERDARTADQDRRRKRLEDVLGAAQAYFERELRDSAEARKYLEGRGLGEDDWSRFGIGYAPNGNCGLRDHLMIERIDMRLDQEEIIAAGLLATSDDRRPPYDRFRHRITFPISSASGHPLSFGGRALDPNARAKYLNGPDTELFDKGRNLYGLDMARKLLAAGPGPLLVSEGYMDVIACLRAGVPACAPMGTSLTVDQLELMWRYHQEPTLCMDGDRAGQAAVSRVIDMAVPKIGPKRSLRFAAITGGKDPDEVLRVHGADALRAQLVKARPMVDAIFERERAREPLDTPERRTDLRSRLIAIYRAIGDRDLANEYREAFWAKLEAMRQRSAGRQAPAGPELVQVAKDLRASIPPVPRALAFWLVKDPTRALDDIETMADVGLGHPQLDRMAGEVLAWLMSHDPDGEQLVQHLTAVGYGELVSGLGDPAGLLADAATWQRSWRTRAAYLQLEAQVQHSKSHINTPEGMRRFMALKAQRDQAKAAL